MNQYVCNPYLPSYEYVPDAEPRVFDGRLYVFGSHDIFNSNDFCLGDYICYSTEVDDLANWKYEGVIYKKEQDPRNADGKMHMCAPDVCRGADGRYYLYYQLHELASTSVAVADQPQGPYEYYGQVKHVDGTPWGEKKGDAFAFDPGVLADDDGSYYLYVGFGPKSGIFKKVLELRGNNVDEAVCLKLSEDMITVEGEEHPIAPGPVKAKGTDFEGHGFFEASSPRKINGKYYFIYSSELSHELCYAISDDPDKNFHYGGTIISIGNVGYNGRIEADNYTGNTHGGIVEVNGQWYVFYHRQTNMQKCARQGCAERIEILEDGTIPQVETTSSGIAKCLPGEGVFEARIAATLTSAKGTVSFEKTRVKNKGNMHPYFTQTGDDRENNGDQYIANMRDGAEAGFRYFDMAGCDEIGVTVAGNGEGYFEIRSDRDGEPIARIEINASDADAKFRAKLKTPIRERTALFFKYKGTGYIDFKSFFI